MMKLFFTPKFLGHALRIGGGVGFVVGGFLQARDGTRDAAISGLLMIVSGAFFFVPELRWLISDRVGRFVSGFIYPEARGEPPLDYTLPRFYRKKERLPEALEHYRRILYYYPKDLTAYLEGIEVAWQLEDAEEAERLYKRGRRKLSDADRELLARHWQVVCPGIEA
jgi:hypothetical protein